MAQIHKSHDGELQLRARRNTPRELSDAIEHYIDSDMPQQHADFYAGLPYLPLATLDHRGRPWVSLLVTKSADDPAVGITVSAGNRTDIVAQTSPHDPFARALQQGPASAADPAKDGERLFAGVGVDFSNRRRNKIAGSIGEASVEASGKMRLGLVSDQHLGNCPKYITVRSLAYDRRTSELAHDGFDAVTSALPEDAKAVVDRASTVFLATKHTAENDAAGSVTDMGLNHRGGTPGFTRIYEQTDGAQVTTYLVLPDHSGNRFYQSLGNIETDPQVGLVFPDFETGHVLYVTGEAENLLDQDAEALMPRVSLLTRVKLTGAVFVKTGLDLKLTSAEQLSPYNPPVRHLRQDLEHMGHATVALDQRVANTATLVSTQALSNSITTFNFRLSSPIDAPLPGGFGVFDFADILDAGYSHMNEANPQLVNEDYVRTWTLSNAPGFDADGNAFRSTDRLSITVKRKPGGLMSNVLHDNADTLIKGKLPVAFKGTGASFTCFTAPHDGSPPSVPSKMLWIAGGVGISPFMSMWDGIVAVANASPNRISTDIMLLFSGRDDDVSVMKHFAAHGGSLPQGVALGIAAFQSVRGSPAKARSARESLCLALPDTFVSFEERRIVANDIQSVADLSEREVFMCGPDALMNWSEATLTELEVDPSRRHRESFAF